MTDDLITTTAKGQARHIRELRMRGGQYREALTPAETVEVLSEYNAEAARMSVVMRQVAKNLNHLHDLEDDVPVTGEVGVWLHEAAEEAEVIADWLAEYASELKRQVEYVQEHHVDDGDGHPAEAA